MQEDGVVAGDGVDRQLYFPPDVCVGSLLVLVTLTGVIWITQALRGIDMMTSQGQTMLVFVGLTGLAIPSLVLVIAPIALVIAVAYVLNKLSTDSEIIVMNAAGMPPWRLFRPFLYATIVVSVDGLLHRGLCRSGRLAPDLKCWDAEITADVFSNMLQPGKFVEIERNLTLRVRERQPGGAAGRHFHRRPARSEGARHDHRRARHGAEERHGARS